MSDEKATEKQIEFAQKLGIDNASTYTKKTLSELIKKKVEEKDKSEGKESTGSEKVAQKGSYNPKSMYVSYAKDIFIEFKKHSLQHERPQTDKGLMVEAIALVQQAKNAF